MARPPRASRMSSKARSRLKIRTSVGDDTQKAKYVDNIRVKVIRESASRRSEDRAEGGEGGDSEENEVGAEHHLVEQKV